MRKELTPLREPSASHSRSIKVTSFIVWEQERQAQYVFCSILLFYIILLIFYFTVQRYTLFLNWRNYYVNSPKKLSKIPYGERTKSVKFFLFRWRTFQRRLIECTKKASIRENEWRLPTHRRRITERSYSNITEYQCIGVLCTLICIWLVFKQSVLAAKKAHRREEEPM